MIKGGYPILTQKVLFIVAHSDDETLGAAGTIARHVESGDGVYAMHMTNGVGGRELGDPNLVLRRNDAAKRAAKILGFNWIDGADFPDNQMDSIPLLSIVKVIERAKALIKPQIIYTHSHADLNEDHRRVCQATLTAFRPQPNESWVEIRTFEVPSATDYGHKSVTNVFCPNLYVNITETWQKKISALKEYDIEMREPPHSRSFEGLKNLARYRGNQSGVEYAEAFEVIRKIER